MISADAALKSVLESVKPLAIERIPLLQALGRVLAEDVYSPRDIPGFVNSAMDGYAVRAADVQRASDQSPVALSVLETIAAGSVPTATVGHGQAARIMTGAPLPEGADAIVPVERTRSARSETVEILAQTTVGEYVRPRGEDLRQGEQVLAAGRVLAPADIGMLASVSRSMLDVWRRPRVAIISTGDEVVDIDVLPAPGQVVNSNAYALAAAIAQAGGEAVILKLARDQAEEIRERLTAALGFDCVLSTGGVSAGQFDYVQHVLDELGMQVRFHGVAQRPGRPLKYGLLQGKPVFGLPGNPVSALVCFYLYARPALLRMGGHQAVGLARLRGKCAVDIRTAADLTEFVRVRIERREGEILLTPTGGQGSNLLSSVSKADGLLVGPADKTVLPAGSQATVLVLAPGASSEVGF